LTQNCTYSLEKKLMKINIIITKKNTEFTANFIVRKKIVAQNRLNYQLVQQIQENKAKIKILKKQIAKLDKTIQNKNEIIKTINENIKKISNVVNDINTNNIENNDSDNRKSTIKSTSNTSAKNSKNNSPSKDKSKNDNIKKINNANEKEKLFLKHNLSITKEFKQNDQEKECKKYINNNRKMKNQSTIKPAKYMNQYPEKPKSSSKDDTIFCFENVDVYKNKRIYELLIIFNIITSLIIMYLLCSIHSFKANISFEKVRDKDLMKKLEFLSLLDDDDDEYRGGIRENIVDFQLKNNYDDNNIQYNNQKVIYTNKKNKIEKEMTLLNSEKEKKYFKRHIRRRLRHKAKDISIDLRYNSREPNKYTNIFYNYKDISEVLVLLRLKNGKKLGLFCNNIILYEQYKDNNDDSNYAGYIYISEQLYEVNLQDFFEKYGKYLQNIYDYLKSENLRVKNRYNETSTRFLGDVDIFEIYQIKYIR